jgi:hypothetical protein
MRKKFLMEILIYLLLFLLIVSSTYFLPKALIILATPYVYFPETFDELYIATTIFDIGEKVVVRANVSDSDAAATPIDVVYMNITDVNGVQRVTLDVMVNTTISCGIDCWIYEENYTLGTGADAPPGTWTIDVYANDTYGNEDTNTTTFTVNKWVELIPSQGILNGVQFVDVDAGTTLNPARNNTSNPSGGTEYNITVDPVSNTNVDFYHKGDDLVHLQISTEIIAVGNVSEASSTLNETNGFSALTGLATAWSIMGDSAVNCTDVSRASGNCWVKYWLDVPGPIRGGTYNTSYYFCGVYTGGASTLC